MLEGFQTKEQIRDDWIEYWKKDSHSDFAVGAERIVYSLLNGKGIGIPNAAPVGSDMFFETSDAYIHIYLKTVEAEGNIGDYATSIFVGENQNSYKAQIDKQSNKSEAYNPSLPTYYNKYKKNAKICLTYFITILYEKENISILNINLICMPNVDLFEVYQNKPLRAGKNPGKARFNFFEVNNFDTLGDGVENSRIKVIFMHNDVSHKYGKKLKFLIDLKNKQDKL